MDLFDFLSIINSLSTKHASIILSRVTIILLLQYCNQFVEISQKNIHYLSVQSSDFDEARVIQSEVMSQLTNYGRTMGKNDVFER
jgi:hypothetical protein